MKYFGTDGIRGVVGEKINEHLLKKVANAVVAYFNKHNLKRVLLVGSDSRISGDFCLSNIESVLLKYGISTEYIGMCSSPCLAFLTKKYNYPLSLMLSASHNSAEYNGLKFFNCNGEKVTEEFEIEFENLMDKQIKFKTEFANRKDVSYLIKDYIAYLKNLIKFKSNFILDCANGGTSNICKQLFPKNEKINCTPNGININKNAGCTHIELLRLQCIKKQKIGFAFDGDGDRVAIVSESGEIISGDKILFILSNFFQSKGDTLVGTIYSNSGIENLLKKRGITLLRAKVGDRNVYRLMIENNSIIGGEDSGHIIIRSLSNTGDGILTAITICNILNICGKSLNELLNGYKEHFQARANLTVKPQFSLTENMLAEIKKMEKNNAKIIVRPSGTEPVLRVFVEHENEEIAKNYLKNIENLIKNA